MMGGMGGGGGKKGGGAEDSLPWLKMLASDMARQRQMAAAKGGAEGLYANQLGQQTGGANMDAYNTLSSQNATEDAEAVNRFGMREPDWKNDYMDKFSLGQGVKKLFGAA